MMKTILRVSIVLSLWFGGLSALAIEGGGTVNANEKDFNAVYDAYKGNPKKAAGAVKTEGDPDPACCGKDMSGVAIEKDTNPGNPRRGDGKINDPTQGGD